MESEMRRILVVEDSRTQAEILCHILKEMNFEVVWVSSGEDAIHEIEKRRPDLVLTDIIMPGMDGYGLCNTIRRDPRYAKMPIILVTQLSDPKDILKGLCCGANNFIIKPVTREILSKQVKSVLDEIPDKLGDELTVQYKNNDYTVRSSRSDLLRILLSIYHTAITKNAELIETTDRLNDFTSHLEEIVEERTHALTATNEIIEQLLLQRSALITRIGHDLKTPLTPLYAMLPYLQSKEDDPDKREILDMLVKDINTLKKLVDKILKLSHLNMGSFSDDISLLDMHHIVTDCIKQNSDQISQKDLMVRNSVRTGSMIRISSFHASSVIENLITNAIKYSNHGGVITLLCYDEGKSRIITVTDTGIGLSEEEAKKVFDDFYKADESRHDHSSHGLGLSIVSRIAALYGGTVSVTSPGKGKGTTFMVQFPRPDTELSADSASAKEEITL